MSSAASTSDNAKTMTWLIVGGAPRSGTTALGTSLSKSRQIAILHEYPSYKFFGALNKFFVEEERQSQYEGFARHGHLIPRSLPNGRGMVHGIFSEIFPGKADLQFVGTKTPRYEQLAECEYPQWVTEKVIHITRNPYEVLLSALKKNDPQSFAAGACKPTMLKRQFNNWVSAWNYAVSHADDPNFLHLFYDDLIAAPAQEKQRVADFLGGVNDFDFLSFRVTQKKGTLDRYKDARLEKFFSYMEASIPFENWLEQARQDYAARKTYKTPLPVNERVGGYLFRRYMKLKKLLCAC